VTESAECYYCGERFDLADLELVPMQGQTYKPICSDCL
jgi:hypothetical protein